MVVICQYFMWYWATEVNKKKPPPLGDYILGRGYRLKTNQGAVVVAQW